MGWQGTPRFLHPTRKAEGLFSHDCSGVEVTHLPRRLSSHLPPPPAAPVCDGHSPSPEQGQRQ